jgi:dethiobiotin synthetase
MATRILVQTFLDKPLETGYYKIIASTADGWSERDSIELQLLRKIRASPAQFHLLHLASSHILCSFSLKCIRTFEML